MCAERKREPEKESPSDFTVNELLSAMSESEYPQYILEAISRAQEWMHDITDNDSKMDDDLFSAIFGESYDGINSGVETLIERLDDLREYADIIPNSEAPEGKTDAMIISITPPEYESGLRSAIDYAAVFNRSTCKRVWIISDTFILDDVMKFSAHVDALSEQGITLRYILVTPWGWVELPLSGNTALKHAFLWRNDNAPEEKTIRRKKEL